MRKKQIIDRFGFIIILFLCAVLIQFRYYAYDSFTETQYIFSLQEGLYSRFLIGTLLRYIFPTHYGESNYIHLVQQIILFLFSMSIIILNYFALGKVNQKNKLYFQLLSLSFFVSPVTFQFYANDVGRLDQFSYLISIVVFALLYVTKNRYLRLAIISIASLCIVFIHEGMLLVNIPLIFFFYFITLDHEKYNIKKYFFESVFVALVLIPSIVFSYLSVQILRFPESEVELWKLVAKLQFAVNFNVSPNAVNLYFRNIEQNILLSNDYLNNIGTFILILFTILTVIPNYIFGFQFVNNIRISLEYSIKKYMYYFLISIAIFSPLLLSFIGFDIHRWISMSIMNLYIVILTLTLTFNNSKNEIHFNSNHLLFSFGSIIIIYLLLGPIKAISTTYVGEKLFISIIRLFN